MSKTDSLPVWVPTRKAWTMAIRLAVPAYALAAIVPAVELWRFVLLGTLLSFVGIEEGLLGFAVALLFLLLGLLWFLFCAAAYSLLLRLLWSSPPKYLKLPMLSTLINRDFGILVTATLPVAITFFAYVGLEPSLYYHLPTPSTFRLSYETFLLECSWIWFVCAVFLYHSYYRTRANVRRKSRHHNKAGSI